MERVVKHVWKYADKMQAEEDKRKVGGVPDAIRENSHIFGSIAPVRPFFTKDKDGNCMHFHHEFGHKKCMDCGDSLDDAKSQLDKMIHDDGLMLKEQARIKGINLEDCSFAKPYIPKWQPDWSQAPDGYNRFVIGSDHGIGFFTDIEPELIDQEYFYVGHNAKVVENHNYQGDWKDSLRKRQ